jgi:hypothetical protein
MTQHHKPALVALAAIAGLTQALQTLGEEAQDVAYLELELSGSVVTLSSEMDEVQVAKCLASLVDQAFPSLGQSEASS